MTDEPIQTPPPKDEEITDLPPQKLTPQDEENTKGGRRGPGTQTEDDVYVG